MKKNPLGFNDFLIIKIIENKRNVTQLLLVYMIRAIFATPRLTIATLDPGIEKPQEPYGTAILLNKILLILILRPVLPNQFHDILLSIGIFLEF